VSEACKLRSVVAERVQERYQEPPNSEAEHAQRIATFEKTKARFKGTD
jgi:hypothetical protein